MTIKVKLRKSKIKKSRRNSKNYKRNSKRNSRKNSFGVDIIDSSGRPLEEVQKENDLTVLLRVREYFAYVYNSIDKSIFISLFQLMIIIFASILLSSNDATSSIPNQIFTYIGGPYLMSNITNKPIENLKLSVTPLLPSFLLDDNYITELRLLEKKLNKNNVNTVIYKKIEELLKETKNLYSQLLKMQSTSMTYTHTQKEFTKILGVIEYLNVLNNNEVLIAKDEIGDIITRIDQLISTYESREQLVASVLKPFVNNLTNSTYKAIINPIYLLGPPGTGKSKFVNELAKNLDVSIYKLDPEDRLFNPEFEEVGYEFKASYVLLYNRLIHKMKSENKPGIIFFIDEIDKITKKGTLDKLLTLLNANQKNVQDEYLGVPANIENILVICAANKNLSDINEKYGPLMSRFTVIEFPSISTELKRSIIMNNLIEQLNRIGLEYDEHRDLQFINDLLNQGSHLEGVRELLMQVGAYVNYLQGNQIFAGSSWDSSQQEYKIDLPKQRPQVSRGRMIMIKNSNSTEDSDEDGDGYSDTSQSMVSRLA